MWKKSDNEYPEPLNVASSQSNALPLGMREQAVIGPSITMKGDLVGEEDLVIQGKVEGTIHLNQFSLTIGKNGRVRADIYAKVIRVEGEVDGNLFGEEQVIVRKTGHVKGNITAPNVALEEGCRFKGSVDMESLTAAKQSKTDTRQIPATVVASTAPVSNKDKQKSDVSKTGVS